MQENQSAVFSSLADQIGYELDLHQDTLPEIELEIPKLAQEPTKAELDDLDMLLAESMAIKHKRPARIQYETVRDSNLPKVTIWTVLETVAVWGHTTCLCGESGPAIFHHFMEKRVGGGVTHWRRVDIHDETKPLRHAVKHTQTRMCALCVEIEPSQMEDIANALR